MPMIPDSRYKAYILRVWHVERDGELVELFSLENCQTGERKAFARLSALTEFIESLTESEHHENCEREGEPVRA